MSKGYSWEDTNLALFGTDEDKKVKKTAALKEEAWQPVLECTEPRLFVWRIEKLNVKPINQNDYGNFFNGDSYIVLNVHKKNRALKYDVHFWIGLQSTQDEYGTAAYKTVELDTLLDDQAVQHREVEQHESKLFKSYFPTFRVLNGGVDSAFRHVVPNEYQPRLLHFHQEGKSHCEIQEVELSVNSLESSDVFILDLGSVVYQWNGSASNKEERYSAAQFLMQLSSERNGKCKTHVLDELSTEDNIEFVNFLPDKPVFKTKKYYESTKCIYKLTDENGQLSFELVAKNSLPKRAISDGDVYFIDTGSQLFVYIGKQCSKGEKQNAMSYAHNYLKHTRHRYIPVTVVGSSQESEELEQAWDKDRSSNYIA